MSRLPRAIVVVVLACLTLLVVRPSTVHAQESSVMVWDLLREVYAEVNKDGFTSRKYIMGQL